MAIRRRQSPGHGGRSTESAASRPGARAYALGPLGKALYTARYLLSLRGPDRLSNPYQNLTKIKNPVLIVQGTADKFIQKEVGKRLQAAVPAGSATVFMSIQGVGHGFENNESVLSDKVLGWLNTVAP